VPGDWFGVGDCAAGPADEVGREKVESFTGMLGDRKATDSYVSIPGWCPHLLSA